MSYVMVPVPEEIKDQVMAVIGQLAFSDAMTKWEPDVLVGFVEQASEPERAIISELVEASEQVNNPTRRMLGTKLELSDTELDAHITELNRRSGDSGNPWLVMVTKAHEAEQTYSNEIISLPRQVAEIIRNATAEP